MAATKNLRTRQWERLRTGFFYSLVMFTYMSDLHREIVEIEELLCRSEQDVSSIRWGTHHPEYPDSLLELMRSIAQSGWVVGDYQKYKVDEVLAHVEAAGFDEIRGAITRLNRSEKWCTGSWIQVMEEGSLKPLIRRAKELSVSK